MSKFVFGEYFVLFGWVFCNVFAEWAKWAKLEGSGRSGAPKIAYGPSARAIFSAPPRPPPSSFAHFAHSAKSWKISAKKNKISPKTNLSSNGNTVILIIYRFLCQNRPKWTDFLTTFCDILTTFCDIYFFFWANLQLFYIFL